MHKIFVLNKEKMGDVVLYDQSKLTVC